MKQPGTGNPEAQRMRHEPIEREGQRIENGVWRPKSLEAFTNEVAVGTTTKLTEIRKEGAGHTPRLRITGDARRAIDDREELEKALEGKMTIEEFRGKKVSAGLQLARTLEQLDPEADPRQMIKTRLVHGTEIKVINETYLAQTKKELVEIKADGLITNLKHIPLLAAAADCAPVFIYDPEKKAVGVFHIGWRGTAREMPIKGIEAMEKAFGSNPSALRVVIGPYADGDNFELSAGDKSSLMGAEGTRFSAEEEKLLFKSHQEKEKILFDNGQAIAALLRKKGVLAEHIEISAFSTMTDNHLFSSERKEGFANRDTLMAIAVLK